MVVGARGGRWFAGLGFLLAAWLGASAASAQAAPQTFVQVTTGAQSPRWPTQGRVPLYVETLSDTTRVELRYRSVRVAPVGGVEIDSFDEPSGERTFYVYPGEHYTLRARGVNNRIRAFEFEAPAWGGRLVVGPRHSRQGRWAAALTGVGVMTQVGSLFVAIGAAFGTSCGNCREKQAWEATAWIALGSFFAAIAAYPIAGYLRRNSRFALEPLRGPRPGVSLSAAILPTPGGGIVAASLTF